MRIISGKFKNKRLFFPKNSKTRPLKDNVRESIFNILQHSKKINVKIENSNILDLYSGSGSFGLESLSRYASKVLFVEKDSDAIKSLKKNIKNLKAQEKIYLYEGNVLDFIEKSNFNKKFDIIFIDPPYSDNMFSEVVKKIVQKNILNKNYIIIIHRDKKTSENLNIKNLNIIENRIYGRSQIFFGRFF